MEVPDIIQRAGTYVGQCNRFSQRQNKYFSTNGLIVIDPYNCISRVLTTIPRYIRVLVALCLYHIEYESCAVISAQNYSPGLKLILIRGCKVKPQPGPSKARHIIYEIYAISGVFCLCQVVQ